jgi:hypothetical protein
MKRFMMDLSDLAEGRDRISTEAEYRWRRRNVR